MEKVVREIKLTFRLTSEDANQFKAQCALEGNTMQDVLERIVKQFVKETKERPE